MEEPVALTAHLGAAVPLTGAIILVAMALDQLRERGKGTA